MKRFLNLLAVLCVFCTLFGVNTSAASLSSQESYTYANDMTAITAPSSHKMEYAISAQLLGVESLSDIADISVYDDNLYILEKTLGKIFVVDTGYKLIKTLGADMGLNAPEGFYVNNGFIYVADTGNGRIVKLDINGNIVTTVGEPDRKKTLSEVDYFPSKIVVDSGERLYIIVKNETNGIYQMDMNGEFLGFFGSVPVVPSLKELMWRAVSTKEQLSRMLLFVPTEYSSMDIDKNGFIYTTVATNTDSEMQSYITSGGSDSTLAPIRRLNPKNIDVLVRNGSMPPAGDLIKTTFSSTDSGTASRFVDIAVKNNGIYCALDSTRSRVFTYDKEGNLLYVFGNSSEKKDDIANPTCLCWWGDNIAVTDFERGEIKVYSPTKYAQLIDSARAAELKGDYEASGKYWNELLDMHSGSNLAFVGIGKQELRSGNYTKAMEWFKKADSAENYSNALKLYRKEIGFKITGVVISVIVIGLVAVIIGKRIYKKKVAERPEKPKIKHEISEGFKYGFYIIRHPFDGFWDMQHESRGNIKSATIILVLTVVLNLVSNFTTGYLISGNRDSNFNILISGVLSVLLPFGLWCIANWSVTSLMNGSGTFKNIYMYSCYSLTPLLIGMPLLIVLSNILSRDEAALYTIVNMLVYVWVGFLLFVGTLVVHQYMALRTLVTIVIIIVAIGIIIFLGLLCATIIQQMTDFLGLLFEEINLRM